MAIVENTAKKLVLRSGSTTLTFDDGAKQATLQSKILFWQRAPVHAAFKDIAEVKLEEVHDPASGAEIYNTMVLLKTGKGGWALAADSKKQAEAEIAAVRKFLGLRG